MPSTGTPTAKRILIFARRWIGPKTSSNWPMLWEWQTLLLWAYLAVVSCPGRELRSLMGIPLTTDQDESALLDL